MPKENFWPETAVVGDDSGPAFSVSWGAEHPGVFLNEFQLERAGINRMIRTLRTARDKAYGRDE